LRSAVPAILWRTCGRPARVGRVERELLDAVKVLAEIEVVPEGLL
jgi:hypothetical protein